MKNMIATTVNDLYNSITRALTAAHLSPSVTYFIVKDILNDLDKMRMAEYEAERSPENKDGDTDETPEGKEEPSPQA